MECKQKLASHQATKWRGAARARAAAPADPCHCSLVRRWLGSLPRTSLPAPLTSAPGWLGLCLLLWGCSSPESTPAEPAPWVDVGLTSGEDGLDFESLEPGGAIPLHSFGQGGTHALLAVRCSGLGARAFVSVTLTNVATGSEVVAPAGQDPRLLSPREEGLYDLLPLLVMTGGLVAPGEAREGLPVRVRVEASNTAGEHASVEREAVLRTSTL